MLHAACFNSHLLHLYTPLLVKEKGHLHGKDQTTVVARQLVGMCGTDMEAQHIEAQYTSLGRSSCIADALCSTAFTSFLALPVSDSALALSTDLTSLQPLAAVHVLMIGASQAV
jgi:hypothetical protein